MADANDKIERDRLNTYKYLRDVVHNMPGHIYWKDKEGHYLGCNRHQAIDAGLESPSEIVGRKDADMPWRDQADYLRKHDLEVMETEKPLRLEEECIIPGQPRRIYLTHKQPLYDADGQVAGVIGISIDITEKKRLEGELMAAKDKAVEAASQAKTEFLENMRHDLRTPLTGIVGYADLIQHRAKDPQIAEYANNLASASHMLMDLLNEILDSVKVLDSDLPTLKRRFSPREIAQQIVTLLTPKAGERGLDLSLHIDKAIPTSVIGDPIRIQRILLELATNALNFTQEGGVTIQLDLAGDEGHEKILKLSVTDTGVGIPDHMLDEIFLRFRRLTPSYKGIYDGYGLGLTISKQFIDDLGGEITCQSREGEGSTFICLIPVQAIALLDEEVAPPLDLTLPGAAEAKENSDTETQPVASAKPEGQTRVLLVEDHHIAAQVAAQMLKQLRCEVDIAEDAQAALRASEERGYDLIFMDIGLPGMSGHEVTRHIRAQERESESHTPIVALTAHIDDENREQCLACGMEAVLSKPLLPEVAEAMLSTFVPARFKPTDRFQPTEDSREAWLDIQGEVVDLAEGLNHVGGNIELAEEMIQLLLKGLEDDLPHLQSAHDKDDWLTIQTIAHKHRGASAYCGTPRLRLALSRLDDYLLTDQHHWRHDLYELFLDEINQLKQARSI